MANLRECIKLPVVDVIFLAAYRWSKAIEYFLRIVLLNTVFAALIFYGVIRHFTNSSFYKFEYFKINILCFSLSISNPWQSNME